jgi:hypothetical protein
MPAHASWRTLLAASTLLLGTGCEPSVSARAVWMDAEGEEGSQTIHVYDRGEIRELELLGASATSSSPMLRLDPRGRGLLVRTDAERAAWIDLADDRRLPFLLPISLVGDDVEFAADGSALLWTDTDPTTLTGRLNVLPVAPGLPLEHTDQSGVQALTRSGSSNWWVTASDAPVALVLESDGTTLGLWRWPIDPDDPMALREIASGSRIGLPINPRRVTKCAQPAECAASVAIDPAGEVAVMLDESTNGPIAEWQRFDVRVPDQAALPDFPSALDELIANSEGIHLIHLIDRDRSLWLSSGLLHWWNQRTGELRSLPVLGVGQYHVLPIERGHAVLFMAISGQVLRADRDGLRPVSVVATPCYPANDPVVSPSGGWIAWTCSEAITDFQPAQEAIIRVSALGLDRFAGVPMTPLAIDDEGHLLLASDNNVVSDTLDGIDSTAVPRNLYVLSREDVLTRVDELEPAPAPVDVGDQYARYIQAAAY